MTDIFRDYEIFKDYFNNFIKYDPKSFDLAINHTYNYAKKHGLNEEDLILLTDIAFQQNLGSKCTNVIKCLIPKRYIPDKAIENVIQWLLENYDTKYYLSAKKLILQWFIGIIEYNLATPSKTINYYYDFFYYFVPYEKINISACKLIYLLTKSEDVNRCYVKKVLKVHEKFSKPTFTGALLYLFKSYRPDCVPEDIPAYAVHKAFGTLPEFIVSSFSKAQAKIDENYTISSPVDEICWHKCDLFNSNVRKKAIQLIPSITQSELLKEMQPNGCKSLLSITNSKDLYKYHISSSAPSRIMALLNNSEGCFILAFGDKILQERFSIQLYYTLYDAFFERNPNVSYKEKDRLLEKLAIFQNQLQQSIPVVSKFISQFLIRWDGHEFEENIFALMEWLHFKSFNELKELILNYIYDLFISATIEKKCRILNFLATLTTNIISTAFHRQLNKKSPLFLDVEIKWKKKDVIDNLYNFIQKLCDLGLYLENCHSLMIHAVIELHEGIMLAEENVKMKNWMISLYLIYACLFTSNPNCFLRIFNLFHRFPSYVPNLVTKEILNYVWNKESFITNNENSVFFSFSSQKILDLQKIMSLTDNFCWGNHFALICYDYKLKQQNKDYEKHFTEYNENAQENYEDFIKFLSISI